MYVVPTFVHMHKNVTLLTKLIFIHLGVSVLKGNTILKHIMLQSEELYKP